MASEAVWRRAAEEDPSDIVVYIADDNVDAAVRVLDAVDETVVLLLESPNLGRVRESSACALNGLRSWPVKGFANYFLFYLPLDDGIEVVRLLHGARNLGAELEDSE